MTNSGSSANLLMMTALQQIPNFPNKGDIIVPMVSWSTTFFPVNQAGYRLKFVDVYADDFNIDVTAVREAIDEDTVGVFAVNLLGAPAELHTLKDICDDAGIVLIEDNCESFGANSYGKWTGTVGLMGSFSFFFSHHLQTMEGGMVLTDDEEIYQYLLSLRAHGWMRDLPDENFIYDKSGDPFEDSFRFILPGYCVRPLEMSGAVGQVQLSKWDEQFKQRIKNKLYLQDQIEDFRNLRLQRPDGFSISSWFGFGFLVENRLAILERFKEVGIECRPIVAGNFLRNPVIQRMNYTVSHNREVCIADVIHDTGFFVGNDGRDLTKEIDLLVSVLGEFE